MIPPEGISNKDEKLTREKLDIWQIGILGVDLFSRGVILEYIKYKYGEGKEGGKV